MKLRIALQTMGFRTIFSIDELDGGDHYFKFNVWDSLNEFVKSTDGVLPLKPLSKLNH